MKFGLVKKKDNDNLINKLNERIENVENKVENNNIKPSYAKEYSNGIRVLVELIVGFFVGGTLGFYIDKYFDSFPILFLFGSILGGISGIYTIWRRNNFKIEEKWRDLNVAMLKYKF